MIYVSGSWKTAMYSTQRSKSKRFNTDNTRAKHRLICKVYIVKHVHVCYHTWKSFRVVNLAKKPFTNFYLSIKISYTCSSFTKILPYNWFRLTLSQCFIPPKYSNKPQCFILQIVLNIQTINYIKILIILVSLILLCKITLYIRYS